MSSQLEVIHGYYHQTRLGVLYTYCDEDDEGDDSG